MLEPRSGNCCSRQGYIPPNKAVHASTICEIVSPSKRYWYQAGEQVEYRLPALSTYLGHVNVAATYWYLSCTSELAAAASARVEARWKGVTQ
jgi:hypothetical protein